jgi:hypothetical protein
MPVALSEREQRCETDNNSFWSVIGCRGMTSEMEYWQLRVAHAYLQCSSLGMRYSTSHWFNNNDETGRLKKSIGSSSKMETKFYPLTLSVRVRVGVDQVLKVQMHNE